MTPDAQLYRLMSWLSPAYPVGGFSYSHGIEYAVACGLIGDRDTLVDWIATVLGHGSGHADGVLFRAAHDAAAAEDGPRLAEISDLARAFRGSAELALESTAQGAAFLAVTRAVWPTDALDRLDGPVAYPVAVAAACAGHGLDRGTALLAYLQAMAANLVSAGLRLVPLGQTDGQRAMQALEAAVVAARDAALAVALDDLGTAAPVIDWASMRHETQYTRLFRS